MQGLADGYFIIPCSMGDSLAVVSWDAVDTTAPEFDQAEEAAASRIARLLRHADSGRSDLITADHFHRRLGAILWDGCGIVRSRTGLTQALDAIPELREEFWERIVVPGSGEELNQSLERAGRVADFLEFAEIMVRDALAREESCGCHLREESQTPEHEPLRNDEKFAHVAVWKTEFLGRKPGTPRGPF